MIHNYQCQSFTLYISRTLDHIVRSTFLVHKCKIMMSPGVTFLKKYNIVNTKILTFFIGPLQKFI